MTNGNLPLVISRFTDPCMTNEDAPKALLLALLVISLPTFENASNNMTNTVLFGRIPSFHWSSHLLTNGK